LTLLQEKSIPSDCVIPDGKKQKTLKTKMTFSGRGVFTGTDVVMSLCPAGANHGIVFKRVDLPDQPSVRAHLNFLQASHRCSALVNGEARVQTVEHVLAALRAFEIDNVLIEISGPEVPILDGSSETYVQCFEAHQICELDAYSPVYYFSSPIYWSKQDVHLIALPSDEYRISYMLDYPRAGSIGTQYYSTTISEAAFKNDIASARTFCLYEEVKQMIDRGLMKNVGMESGLVFNASGVMNPGGLRFSNEPVRHKILDLVGDLSLTGVYFNAHIIAVKSGHTSNHCFGLELLTRLTHTGSPMDCLKAVENQITQREVY
jgi:UDP-3-O-[3-hydroxymyristoyl] N-acetylglucosamine deacetylase